MRRFRSLAAALMVGFAAPACAQISAGTKASTADMEKAYPGMDANYLAFQKAAHLPGMVWGVVKDGKLVHFGASGVQDIETNAPVNAQSMFRIASMSKAFTALAILKLRDDGKLQLDALAETYVPELKGWTYPTTDSPRIRVRDLLSHVGGFVTDDPWGDRQQPLTEEAFTRMLRDGVPFTRAPQTQMEYSNFGYALLGRIVTNVSGRPYNAYIKAELMQPLGMTSTTYEVRDVPAAKLARGYRWENDAWSLEPTMPHGVFGAMGGVVASADDYVKWVSFLLDAWPARDGAEKGPVRRSTVRELSQGLNFPSIGKRPGLEGNADCTFAAAYGMGFTAAQDCDLGFTLTHNGGYPGYGSNVLLLPNQGIGIFAFANRTYAGPGRANREAALHLHKAGALKGRDWPVSDRLAAAHKAVGAMYVAGSVEPGRNSLSMNFLMDRSAENWAKEFARLKEQAGACKPETPVEVGADGLLSGWFTWTCEKGEMDGNIVLAPTQTPQIQTMRFGFVPPAADKKE
jgi:CubicO group peptidase (beta-lactamase class C family)